MGTLRISTAEFTCDGSPRIFLASWNFLSFSKKVNGNKTSCVLMATHRKQNNKELHVNPEDIPFHSHENCRDYNFRIQDRSPRSKGSSGAPWQDCRILKKWKCSRGHVWADIELKEGLQTRQGVRYYLFY